MHNSVVPPPTKCDCEAEVMHANRRRVTWDVPGSSTPVETIAKAKTKGLLNPHRARKSPGTFLRTLIQADIWIFKAQQETRLVGHKSRSSMPPHRDDLHTPTLQPVACSPLVLPRWWRGAELIGRGAGRVGWGMTTWARSRCP